MQRYEKKLYYWNKCIIRQQISHFIIKYPHFRFNHVANTFCQFWRCPDSEVAIKYAEKSSPLPILTASYRFLPHFTGLYRFLRFLTDSYRLLLIWGYFFVLWAKKEWQRIEEEAVETGRHYYGMSMPQGNLGLFAGGAARLVDRTVGAVASGGGGDSRIFGLVLFTVRLTAGAKLDELFLSKNLIYL